MKKIFSNWRASGQEHGNSTESPVETTDCQQAAKPEKRKESTRDTVESILFAFILAFLFRTFEAEAFVIPTGSMAPTLYGRHKETDCTQCGFHITVGASDEVLRGTNILGQDAGINSALCSNCGFENKQIAEELAFNGDRILVNKYPYEFGDPKRFDVFVFKYPEDPETNYIKRLVGLPGELIKIRGGNVYSVTDRGEQILRKTPYKQKALQIPVYDDTYHPTELLKLGWPERWAAMKAGNIGQLGNWSDSQTGWEADRSERTYSLAAGDQQEWLRYRHYFPSVNDWYAAAQGYPLNPKAKLVADFCGYNTSTYVDTYGNRETVSSMDTGIYWVRDLTVNLKLQVSEVSEQSEIVLEVCEGTAWYRCILNPKTGAARLVEINSQLDGHETEVATAETDLQGAGEYRLRFANVDDRLCLWIDNDLVDFGDAANLQIAGATANPFPTSNDLTPIGIAGQHVQLEVSHLLIERDIYYRADFRQATPEFTENNRFESRLSERLDDPDAWADIYAEYGDELDTLEIQVGENHYLALGDNSPRSLDSRLWTQTQSVPRDFLVGEAFFIYWPHGVPFLNNGRGFNLYSHRQQTRKGLEVRNDYPRFVAPFYPQVQRMRKIL